MTTMSPEQRAVTMRVLLAAIFVCCLIFIGMIYALNCGHDGIMVAAVSTVMGGIITGACGFTLGKVLK